MSTEICFGILFLNLYVCKAWQSTKKIIEDEYSADEVEVTMFCMNKQRLIKLERKTEFFPVDTSVNDSISMQCKYCEDEDDSFPKTWNHQRRIFSGNVTEVEQDVDVIRNLARVFVTKIHSLVIRNVQEKDMGLYFCKAPFVDKLEKSFNYLVDIMNKSAENIKGDIRDWKNYSETYLQPLNRKFSKEDIAFVNQMRMNISLFSDWSEWSQCDACSPSAKRYRIGICRVKPICENSKKCFDPNLMENDTFFDEKHNLESSEGPTATITNVEDVHRHLIQFSISLSCRSALLKTLLPHVHSHTSNIPDFIIQSKCTGPCQGRISGKGAKYKRSIVLTEGAHLTLVCPDSTIDDEIRWEHNKRRLYANEEFNYVKSSDDEPRIYVDSFNTLYLYDVTNEESGNFTCFINQFRMQEISVIVLKKSVLFSKEFNRHMKYLGIVFLICFVSYLSGVVLLCVRHKREEGSRGRKQKTDESERLLDSYD